MVAGVCSTKAVSEAVAQIRCGLQSTADRSRRDSKAIKCRLPPGLGLIEALPLAGKCLGSLSAMV